LRSCFYLLGRLTYVGRL